MTKQEEIIQEIAEFLAYYDGVESDWDEFSDVEKFNYKSSARVLAFYLEDKGVMIKVKCPDCNWSQFGDEAVGMTPCYSCNSTGYITEPLIEKGE